MHRTEDSSLIGQRFGECTVLSGGASDSPNKKVQCRCSCGTEKDVFWNNLKYGKTKSCGCQAHRFKSKDLRGQRFGALQALQELKDRDHDGNVIWHCRCSCGETLAVSSRALLRGEKTSCGCLRQRNLKGQHFGELTVCSALPKEKDRKYWLCVCSCGKKTKVFQGNLLNGHTQSCGCLKEKEYRTMAEGTCIDVIASTKRPVNNTSGYKGVSPKKGKWVAYLNLKGKRYNLGTYSELSDAIQARKEGEQRYFEPLIRKYKGS